MTGDEIRRRRRRRPRAPGARARLESTLSIQRAFVVHLGAAAGPGRRRFTGRVEHLASGESAHFASLRELLAFLDRWRSPPPP